MQMTGKHLPTKRLPDLECPPAADSDPEVGGRADGRLVHHQLQRRRPGLRAEAVARHQPRLLARGEGRAAGEWAAGAQQAEQQQQPGQPAGIQSVECMIIMTMKIMSGHSRYSEV